MDSEVVLLVWPGPKDKLAHPAASNEPELTLFIQKLKDSDLFVLPGQVVENSTRLDIQDFAFATAAADCQVLARMVRRSCRDLVLDLKPVRKNRRSILERPSSE